MFFFPILTYLLLNTGIPRLITKTQVDSRRKVRNSWFSQYPVDIIFFPQDDIFDGYESTDIYEDPKFMNNFDSFLQSNAYAGKNHMLYCSGRTPYGPVYRVFIV